MHKEILEKIQHSANAQMGSSKHALWNFTLRNFYPDEPHLYPVYHKHMAHNLLPEETKAHTNFLGRDRKTPAKRQEVYSSVYACTHTHTPQCTYICTYIHMRHNIQSQEHMCMNAHTHHYHHHHTTHKQHTI
jgi:hypothetical protein